MQRPVDVYFNDRARFWADVYRETSLYALHRQQRQSLALTWVDRLRRLPPGSRVLEVGCGAGFAAVALAERGFQVEAVDGAAELVELTRRHAAEAGVGHLLRATVGDVHHLEFGDGSFRLVVALGVFPWLHAPWVALREIARVLEPGGYLISTVGNRGRLAYLLDPRVNPALVPMKRAIRQTLQRAGFRRAVDRHVPSVNSFWPAEFDRMLTSAGLETMSRATFGFGPFTLLGHYVVPDRLGVFMHRRLQSLADRGLPGLRSAGGEYLVLAHKADPAAVTPYHRSSRPRASRVAISS